MNILPFNNLFRQITVELQCVFYVQLMIIVIVDDDVGVAVIGRTTQRISLQSVQIIIPVFAVVVVVVASPYCCATRRTEQTSPQLFPAKNTLVFCKSMI